MEFSTQYNGNIPNHNFALQVNGDSMEPMFEDKEIIFIDKTKQSKSTVVKSVSLSLVMKLI
ncbi:S24 family peptidase [Staphylococcus coagulans]|uniref:S24 family peptidase n=1 Tax=Staphylococcus coagulans TaxID=74706 RepID=UPI003CC96B79